MSSIIKQSFRKIKYLDKTQLRYFIVMSFLVGFCLFTGGTYSYFAFSKHLNAATIAIAKLNYTLSSTDSGYTNGTITIGPGETKSLELTLNSFNSMDTKYALRYSTNNPGVKVYYSQNNANNMSGVIGPRGSSITMRVVIDNTSSTSDTVTFTIKGGYLQNELSTNITDGYYEADIIVRAILLEDDFENGLIGENFPAKTSDYVYLRTQCTGDVQASWDRENWKLNLDNITHRESCDVYFKKVTKDIEIVYVLKGSNGQVTYATSTPDDSYAFEKAECSSEATAEWDASSKKLNVSNISDRTVCVAHFKQS